LNDKKQSVAIMTAQLPTFSASCMSANLLMA
jgi:hypothetical protein